MTDFYIVAVCLVVFASLFWLLSVRNRPKHDMAEQLALAREYISTYRLRQRELNYEHELETIDENEYHASLLDLKRQLLHDLSSFSQTDMSNRRLGVLLPGTLFLTLFVSGFYFANGAWSKLHHWQEVKAALPSLGDRALMGKGEPLSDPELQQFALALRSKLHDSGEDVNAWMVFAEVSKSIRDFDAALLAYERGYRLDPNKPSVLLGYAQILAMTGEEESIRQAAAMLSRVLQKDPSNIQGLMTVAYIAEIRKEWDKAKLSYELVAKQLPADDQRQQILAQRIAQLGGDAATQTATVSNGAASKASIAVTIELTEAVKQRLPSNGTLFIYAKAAQGRPMPAAVVKLTQFNFPLTVELSDANAMLQDYTLSSLSEAVIFARVSVDGDIAVSAGELQGQSEVLKVNETKAVSIKVDQVL